MKQIKTALCMDNQALSFTKGDLHMLVRQVRSRNEDVTNGSNNVGSWVVLSTNVPSIGLECNDLAYLVELLQKA